MATRRRRPLVDRGKRPQLRGRLHSDAAWFFAGTGTALICMAAALTKASALTAVTVVYVLCLTGMLGVSATYHRFPWRSERAVDSWRRADHAMIALFIAGTYGPVFVGTDADNVVILIAAWVTALVAVALNVVWINHPRWLSVPVYLVLGWLAVFGFRSLADGLTSAELGLIIAGGVVYTLGAISYGLKRPNISDRWFGFHELFHAATIVAAGMHHIAVWMIVFRH